MHGHLSHGRTGCCGNDLHRQVRRQIHGFHQSSQRSDAAATATGHAAASGDAANGPNDRRWWGRAPGPRFIELKVGALVYALIITHYLLDPHMVAHGRTPNMLTTVIPV